MFYLHKIVLMYTEETLVDSTGVLAYPNRFLPLEWHKAELIRLILHGVNFL
jgi:hypothetical protein